MPVGASATKRRPKPGRSDSRCAYRAMNIGVYFAPAYPIEIGEPPMAAPLESMMTIPPRQRLARLLSEVELTFDVNVPIGRELRP
jgi:hypothetical protein